MRKFSAPPMIIILDVLFVVLFILVLEQSPDIKIVLPKDVVINDTFVASVDKNRKIQHWYDNEENQWKNFTEFPSSSRKFSFVFGNIACKTTQFCRNLNHPFSNEKKKIYITGDLYDEVSGLISDSCLKFPKQCSNVTYHITKEGTVDKEQLKKDHQIFRYILREDSK